MVTIKFIRRIAAASLLVTLLISTAGYGMNFPHFFGVVENKIKNSPRLQTFVIGASSSFLCQYKFGNSVPAHLMAAGIAATGSVALAEEAKPTMQWVPPAMSGICGYLIGCLLGSFLHKQ